ncbi:MAG: hypothetical protein ACKO22_10755 [Cyanobium sp.]
MEIRRRNSSLGLNAALSARMEQAGMLEEIPRDRLAEQGMGADLAYQLMLDHLMLDGNARLNLATFVGTWLEPQGRRLMEECIERAVNWFQSLDGPRPSPQERQASFHH